MYVGSHLNYEREIIIYRQLSIGNNFENIFGIQETYNFIVGSQIKVEAGHILGGDKIYNPAYEATTSV